MIAFEVSIDGQKACVAGVAPSGVTTVMTSWVRRPALGDGFEEELTLDVAGLTHDPDGTSVQVSWIRRPLQVDQRITIAVVETEAADPPLTRKREDPACAADRKREYYERLKREYGDG